MRYLLFLLILSSFFACKKDEIKTYSAPEGISFWAYTWQDNHINPIPFSFAYELEPKERDTFFVRMRVSGKLTDRIRTVQLKAVEGSTARAGIDYILPAYNLPANVYEFEYPVIIINTPEMLTNTFRLVLEPLENSDFKLGSMGTVSASAAHNPLWNEINFKRIMIDANNMLVQPDYWNDGYFGTFSAVKFRFMVQVTGLTDFSEEAIGVDGTYNLPVTLQNALDKYEAINGELYDENEERVRFN